MSKLINHYEEMLDAQSHQRLVEKILKELLTRYGLNKIVDATGFIFRSPERDALEIRVLLKSKDATFGISVHEYNFDPIAIRKQIENQIKTQIIDQILQSSSADFIAENQKLKLENKNLLDLIEKLTQNESIVEETKEVEDEVTTRTKKFRERLGK